MTQNTEVIHASDTRELCVRILELREPGTLKAYAKALAKYERDLKRGGRKQVTARSAFFAPSKTGYYRIAQNGDPEFVERPRRPTPAAYFRLGYSRQGGYTTHARAGGLLPDAQYNRDILHRRVEQYAAEMKAGRWRDLLSDPISITDDGQVLNGQHRIAAASEVDWSEVGNDPAFLVIWDVEPHESHFADGSRRTDRDEKVIADKLVASLSANRERAA
jgi:hypothetical protein